MSSHDTGVKPSSVEEPQTAPDLTVRCRECNHEITQRKHVIQVSGSHEHTFRNPAGYSFHLLCYAEAPGCLWAGLPTGDATWFPGFDWSFALCGSCHTHLGWWYVGTERTFAGLIATRLLRPM